MSVRYLSAEKLTHDDFSISFTMKQGEVVYDARTVLRGGMWATMTQESFDKYGCGQLGLGHGQKYVRNEAGHLVKVEG